MGRFHGDTLAFELNLELISSVRNTYLRKARTAGHADHANAAAGQSLPS
jgi:hypothetical protein